MLDKSVDSSDDIDNVHNRMFEESLFFIDLVAFSGGTLIGYKKAKSITRINFREFFDWNKNFFGPDSSSFEKELNFSIFGKYIAEFLQPVRNQPIHHRYVLTPEGAKLFWREELSSTMEKGLSRKLVWSSLPAKYSVAYVLKKYPHPKEEKVFGEQVIDSYILMSDYRVEKLLNLWKLWKIDNNQVIRLKKAPSSYIIRIDPKFISRYNYLKDFSIGGIEKDFREALSLLSTENPIFSRLEERGLVDKEETMKVYSELKEEFQKNFEKYVQKVDEALEELARFYESVNESNYVLRFDPPYAKLNIGEEGLTKGEIAQIKHALQISELLTLMELRSPKETLSLIWG